MKPTILIFMLILLQTVNSFSQTDAFADSYRQEQKAIEDFLSPLKEVDLPIARFLVCARFVVNINAYLANPKNIGVSNFQAKKKNGDDYGRGKLPNEEEKGFILKQIGDNNTKIVQANLKLSVRQAAL